MTHTPGPWRVHSEHADRIIVNGCCVYQVRDMTTEDGYAGNGYGQPSPVDVRLMAVAPEMLSFLQRLYGWEDVIEEFDADLHAELLAVLAKAEGRGE